MQGYAISFKNPVYEAEAYISKSESCDVQLLNDRLSSYVAMQAMELPSVSVSVRPVADMRREFPAFCLAVPASASAATLSASAVCRLRSLHCDLTHLARATNHAFNPLLAATLFALTLSVCGLFRWSWCNMERFLTEHIYISPNALWTEVVNLRLKLSQRFCRNFTSACKFTMRKSYHFGCDIHTC